VNSHGGLNCGRFTTWWFNLVVYPLVVPLGKVLGWLYLLGQWVRLFNPFASKASGFGGLPDSFSSSLAYPLPSGFSSPKKTPITLLWIII
jgi:hypothetical protein